MLSLLKQYFFNHGVAIVYALVLLLIGIILAHVVKFLLKRLMARSHWDRTVTGFFSKLVYGLIILLTIIAVLSKLGVPTTSMIAVLTAISFAIAYSLRDSLSHFAAGILLVALRPVKVGDYIVSGNTAGTIEMISIFYTTLITDDDQRLMLPNGRLINNQIVSDSAHACRRVRLMITIDYDFGIEQAKSVLMRILTADARVLIDPRPIIAMDGLTSSSSHMRICFWVKQGDYTMLKAQLIEEIKKGFDACQTKVSLSEA